MSVPVTSKVTARRAGRRRIGTGETNRAPRPPWHSLARRNGSNAALFGYLARSLSLARAANATGVDARALVELAAARRAAHRAAHRAEDRAPSRRELLRNAALAGAALAVGCR